MNSYKQMPKCVKQIVMEYVQDKDKFDEVVGELNKTTFCCDCSMPIKTYNFWSVRNFATGEIEYQHNECDEPLWEDDSDEE